MPYEVWFTCMSVGVRLPTWWVGSPSCVGTVQSVPMTTAITPVSSWNHMSNLSFANAEELKADREADREAEDREYEEYLDMEMPIETTITTSNGEVVIVLTEEHRDGDMDWGDNNVEYETTVTCPDGAFLLPEVFFEISHTKERSIESHLKMVAALKLK